MNTKNIAVASLVAVVLFALLSVLQITENNAREFRKNNPQTEVILGTRVDAAGTLQLIKQ